ncbi:MAG: hypothetical protein MUF79_13705, partial [Burkholderiales bacterium]|nr:hypothetical protein [Burkholderiales bacterium]
AMRDGLRHAAACPAPSHLECPSFRRLMSAAASGKGRKKLGRSRPNDSLNPTRAKAARAG